MKNKSTILTLVSLLCFGNPMHSMSGYAPPPDNDLCAGAIDLGVVECQFYVEYDPDPEATSDIEATGNCINNTEPAQWYTFTTPDPLEYGTFVHFNPAAKIEIFSSNSDCSELVYVDCGIGPFGFSPEPATTYYYLTTGPWHMQPPTAGLSDCDDPLSSFNFTQNPVFTSSYNDCGAPSPDVVCQNEHVVWFEYTVGCGESSDVLIDVGPFSNNPSITANELSITVALFDCSVLLSEYDENGLGYVCSAIGAGESINLIDVPPGLSFVIGIGSDDYNAGFFDLFITETTNSGSVDNDECVDAIELDLGLNESLTNACSMSDEAIPGCGPQSEATVWYEFDPGVGLHNFLITLSPISIESPAIAIYDACLGNLLGSECETSIELMCIEGPIIIQIGSSFANGGFFDLEIEVEASLLPIEPLIINDNICSEEETGITIDIPNGEIVDIVVEVAPWSSIEIGGMTNQTFTGVNSAVISDLLTNYSPVAQEAIYLVTINASEDFCPGQQIEVSIMVYPGFTTNEFSLDECLPFILDVNVNELITGGTLPYSSTRWYWNATELVGSDNGLQIDLEGSGTLTLEIVDSEGCSENANIDIELTPTVTPTFDFPLIYCRSKQDLIVFPLYSIEDIPGSWSTPFLDLNVISNDGMYQIIFTAEDPHCIVPVVFSIQIHSGIDPIFDLPDIICPEENEYIFPTEDENGLPGTWEIPTLDVSSITGMQTNVFTPISEDCYAPYEYEFEIPGSIDLEFGQPSTLCRLDDPYELSNLSIDGYEGTWDTPLIDPSTIATDSFVCTWTPLEGQFPCSHESSVTFQIVDPIIPEFYLPNELCKLSDNYTLPTIDEQAISGTWSVPVIDVSEITGSVQSIFTPTDNCVESFTWEIQIVDPLIPEFDLVTELCSLDDVYTLPVVSDNGISGEWTQPTIDPSMLVGEQITVEFLSDLFEFCVEPLELQFEITEAQNPVFDLPSMLCWTDSDVVLPTISNNGIEGTWIPEMIDVQSNLGATISSTFMPTDGSCTHDGTQTFEIESPYIVETDVTDPSDCAIEDGSILLDVESGTQLEFSIDGGMSWQSSTLFTSLGSGGFTILMRSIDLNYCALSVDAFLSSPDGPVINEVSSFDISSCVEENGSILVDADGDNLEYSIDGGFSWQSSNAFDDLSEGEYVINIREEMSDCIVDVEAMILDFPQTEIVTVNIEELTDCDVNNGQIEIVAIGEALEYSIDGGTTWSAQNIFNNLSDGDYLVMVQSIEGMDCSVMTEVELVAPDVPEIINIELEHTTLCSPSIGIIEVEAQGSNLEYSIDGGSIWQDAHIFTDLESGIYQVVVRDSLRINCFDEVMAEIILEDENLPESTFITSPPSECDGTDGSIEISNSTDDVEYSIDGGMSWQTTNIYVGLSPISYEIITRKVALPECLIVQSIEIPNIDCPCNDLTLEFEVSSIACTGISSGKVELTTIQGMKHPDIDIQWQNGESTQIVEGVDEGWQVVTILYDDDCTWIDSIWVELVDPILYGLEVKNLDCPEIDNGTINIVDVTGGSGNYEYSIDGITYQDENTFDQLIEGTYDVYVRDDEDCLVKDSIDIIAFPKVEIYLSEIEEITIGDRIVLDPGIDIREIDSFAWNPLDDIVNPSELIVTVSPTITSIYSLKIYYGDCMESKDVLINVSPKEEVHIGNVFSPNGDNNNDIMYIQGKPNSTIELNDFSVYDRWGNEVFKASQPELNNQEDGWDGQLRGESVAPGVYVYMINYVQDGEQEVKFGTVTVVY